MNVLIAIFTNTVQKRVFPLISLINVTFIILMCLH